MAETDPKEMTNHLLLHVLWTKAVGTPGYDKNEWKELEQRFDSPYKEPMPDPYAPRFFFPQGKSVK